ncbi:MAG: ABC transporter permease [Gemmatimonadota bacterium]|nr:ABC transporter permease [Gemmatimonadota bacterium]
MERLGQDIRFAIRALRRNPGFTLIAMVTIALGIGVNTSIFSVVNSVLLSPMPYADADRLYTIWENHELRDWTPNEWTGRSTFADWRERSETFDAMSAVTGWAPNMTGVDRPDVLQGALVSPDYFTMLGVNMYAGRGFLAEEETPGNDAVVVIGHDFWQERLGGARDVVGTTVTLNGEPHVIVGIAPAGFDGPIVSGAEIWGTLAIDRSQSDRGSYFLRVIGRLRDGATLPAAQADMDRVAIGIAEENPRDYEDVSVTIDPLRATVVGPVRTPLLVLLGTVGLVLLIACANVANLLLARASVRERELAVRASLGAGRGRLVRQMLTEAVVLGIGGGLLGLALGVWGTALLVQAAPAGLPRLSEIGLDATVFLYALGASVVTGLLFGLAPALGQGAGASARSLREGSRGSSFGAGGRLRNALVVGELALGVAVLVAAGLLLRSFQEMRSVDPGFRVSDALSARILLPSTDYPDRESLVTFMTQLEERLAARPGVEAVGAATILPLSGNVSDVGFGVEGRLPEPGREPLADLWRATPGFFEAMGMPLLSGRYLEASDRDGGLEVAVVSRSMVEQHFPGEDPLGKRIRVGGVQDPESPWWTIVGVVETVRTRAIARAPEPEVFLPYAQLPARGMSIVVHADGDPAALAADLREAVWSLDPNMPLSNVATLDEVFASSIAPERFISLLLAGFAALALVLGAVGIYGVMAFMVAQRTREIGIRMALGARPGHVLGSVMRRGMILTGVGVTLGLLAAVAAGRGLSTLLFGISPNDPLTLGSVALLLGLAAMFACYWPARRATRVDPIITLRAE